jgi:hypothetical protein
MDMAKGNLSIITFDLNEMRHLAGLPLREQNEVFEFTLNDLAAVDITEYDRLLEAIPDEAAPEISSPEVKVETIDDIIFAPIGAI